MQKAKMVLLFEVSDIFIAYTSSVSNIGARNRRDTKEFPAFSSSTLSGNCKIQRNGKHHLIPFTYFTFTKRIE